MLLGFFNSYNRPKMQIQFAKQSGEPLYPKIIWNRPVSKARGGRLLVLGGHARSFSHVQAQYQLAVASGIGQCTLVLPDSLTKALGHLPDIVYAPSSASGSLGRAALGQILELAGTSDSILIGGDLTNNSETAVLVESLLAQYSGPVIVGDEAVAALAFNPQIVAERPGTTAVLSMGGVLALANALKLPLRLRPDGGLMGKIDLARQLSSRLAGTLAAYSSEIIVINSQHTTMTPLTVPLPQPSPLAAAVAQALSGFDQ
jgi:hypothetical protein